MEDSDNCTMPVCEVVNACYVVAKYLAQLPVVSGDADGILIWL